MSDFAYGKPNNERLKVKTCNKLLVIACIATGMVLGASPPVQACERDVGKLAIAELIHVDANDAIFAAPEVAVISDMAFGAITAIVPGPGSDLAVMYPGGDAPYPGGEFAAMFPGGNDTAPYPGGNDTALGAWALCGTS